MSDSLQPHGLHSPQNSPGQSTGVGGLSLLQGIFSAQGWNPGLLHCRRMLHQLSHRAAHLCTHTKHCHVPGGTVVKNPPVWAGDTGAAGLILGSGRPLGEGNGNPLQYSCLENPMDRGTRCPTVHGFAKSQI